MALIRRLAVRPGYDRGMGYSVVDLTGGVGEVVVVFGDFEEGLDCGSEKVVHWLLINYYSDYYLF